MLHHQGRVKGCDRADAFDAVDMTTRGGEWLSEQGAGGEVAEEQKKARERVAPGRR